VIGATAISPVLPMLAAALALPLLSAPARRLICVAAPLAALYLAAVLPDGAWLSVSFLGYDLELLRCDALSRIFGLVFALAATAANLYGWYRERTGEQVAALLYAGGGMAVVYAGDLLSVLMAWEVMAVASAVLVFGGRGPNAVAAGQRYLLVHLAAGSLMLLGVAAALAAGEPIAFDGLAGGHWSSYAILAALCINAAVPPLHAWLPDAYPEASVSGSVFLSTFTTKASVYCLVRGFAGEEILLWAGAAMALYGVVFATMEDDMRRLLAYHIVSQVGYMVCGVGVGSALAINGSVAHAVCHILYKALLFMAVGAVIYRTGRCRLSALGGLYATMPVTLGLYMVGALSISGAPLFNGFVSKSLVVSGTAEAHHTWPLLLLTLASVGTFLSVGLKLPYYAWGHAAQPAERAGEAPPPMLAAMALLAALCVGIGVYPRALYALLPLPPVDYHPYTAYHVFEALLVMAFCAAAFWQARVRLAPHAGRTVDLDELYRRPSRWLAAVVSVRLDGAATLLGRRIDGWRAALVEWVRDPTSFERGAAGEKKHYDENAKRPPVANVLGLILATLALLAAALFVAGS
jgi:multicomponent Na+:H+ antiporter subunit D